MTYWLDTPPTEIEERLVHWRPAMAEYLSDPSISSGFLSTVMSDGLSTALHEHGQTRQGPTTEPALAKGAALHAWLTQDETTTVWAAVGCDSRSGGKWSQWLAWATARGVDVLLTQPGMLEIARAAASLERLDTPKKREIRSMFRDWRSWPEVSHRWVPQARDGEPVDGAVCRIRQDLVARSPRGLLVSVQVKTTGATGLPESSWWPFWRRWYKRSAAFYRAGMRDLAAGEPLKELYVVARLVEPYPWTWYDLAERFDELDRIWYDELVPEIRTIAECLARGERYGPEERGLEA